MSRTKKLDIIYHNGQPDGIRSIHRVLSAIMTYVIPRPLLSQAKQITGIDRPGIYYLINESDGNNIAQLYIGQTRNGVARLDDHNRSKDFWNKAILFLSDNKTFNLDIISGLEQYAIIHAHNTNRYKLENIVKPKYKVDEYDQSTIEESFDEIQFILATLGYKMNNPTTDNANQLFKTSRNGIVALGVYGGDMFEVLEGSVVDMSRPCQFDSVNASRDNALKNGDIMEKDGEYVLTKSMQFKTPSGAACFVLGGSANGWVEWKSQEGKTLDEIYRNK